MRNTRVYSITMPPEMARQAERLAQKENRSMSELMREAFRRYQQPATAVDMREYVRMIAPADPALRAIREEAKRKGCEQPLQRAGQAKREPSAADRDQHAQEPGG